ncbi:response regulator transcription factor [Luteolibacter arcticus]|uniref:Response regulator transcription factor n=1 Tax=Luteolibacter arcticus TaxID=1581411 RepID=A0ABT3GPX5_9BACT|nr:response regulator transcription factor [Luteolibacter arcticus]MCW1925539.1 response regulator transcription factor [Luteolibacter arcticus]
MTILLAEDDPLTLEALAACIEDEGFRTLSAADGKQALELWALHRPQLLCLDIMMPGVDGFEVCRRVRATDSTVPILFLSAKNEEADVVVGLGLGADDFIRKPFTRAEVIARIRAALRRVAPENGRVFTMKDLTVRPEALGAERNGRMIELTRREVSMLELLHRHAGKPVSRDAFLDACWGLDYFPDSRTLDQHVLMLRKKVEADPSKPEIIETVRGTGYRFAPAKLRNDFVVPAGGGSPDESE